MDSSWACGIQKSAFSVLSVLLPTRTFLPGSLIYIYKVIKWMRLFILLPKKGKFSRWMKKVLNRVYKIKEPEEDRKVSFPF